MFLLCLNLYWILLRRHLFLLELHGHHHRENHQIHDHHHVQHGHDHNLRAAFIHVAADAAVSVLVIVGLLTILSIASVIGTVLKQNEPYPNYAFEFGPFWFKAFEYLGLYDVYHAGWFLLILAFLMLSTTLCIVRNGPVFIRDMKGFREKANESALKAIAMGAFDFYSKPIDIDKFTEAINSTLAQQPGTGQPGERKAR